MTLYCWWMRCRQDSLAWDEEEGSQRLKISAPGISLGCERESCSCFLDGLCFFSVIDWYCLTHWKFKEKPRSGLTLLPITTVQNVKMSTSALGSLNHDGGTGWFLLRTGKWWSNYQKASSVALVNILVKSDEIISAFCFLSLSCSSWPFLHACTKTTDTLKHRRLRDLKFFWVISTGPGSPAHTITPRQSECWTNPERGHCQGSC